MKRLKWVLAFALVALLAYLGSYVVNSLFGGYSRRLEPGGTSRYSGGLAMRSTLMWQPRFGRCAPSGVDALGWLFYPLIEIDRSLLHKNKDVFRDEEEIYSVTNAFQFHPDPNR